MSKTLADVKLSPTQVAAIAYLREHGGVLLRLPGGFWTTPDTPHHANAPVWSVDIRTVHAMERKGVLRRRNVWEEWKDERELTEAFAAAVRAAKEQA